MAGRLKLVAKIQLGSQQIQVLTDIEALKKQVKRFSKGGITRAQFRALNRSANKAKTFTSRLLSKDFNIKVSALKPFLFVSPRASARNSTVAIRGASKRLPIYNFAKGAKRQGALGVRFNSGGGAKVHSHTFIATMPSGHTGIFIRKTVKRYKRDVRISPTTGKRYLTQLAIRELTYPSVAHMITNKGRATQVFESFVNDYPRQLHAQLDFELKKSKGVV